MQVSQVLGRPLSGRATAYIADQLVIQHGWPTGLALDHSVERWFEGAFRGYILARPVCILRSVEVLPVVCYQLHMPDNLGAGNHSAVEDTAPAVPVAQSPVSLAQAFIAV